MSARLAEYERRVRQADELELTEELLRVSGASAAFTGLYFMIAMLTDPTYREEFLDGLTEEMREVFKARTEYLRALPA